MTMQRIDENTYVDDTLVTCAEYQLFIDEMREQGKYYQPDHWTSYQFSKGQAKEPILGVRHADAVVFCEWLTQHNKDEWHYRLPTQREAQQHPVRICYVCPICFFILNQKLDIECFWIGDVPANPRAINYDRVIRNIADYAIYVQSLPDNEFILTFKLKRHHPDYIKKAIDSALDRILGFKLERNLGKALDAAHAINVALNEYWSLDKVVTDEELQRWRNQAHTIIQKPKLVFSRVANRSIYRPINLDINLSPNSSIDDFLDIYIDLYTIQERMAGRSPAFEGIRIVKERKP